MVKAADLRSAGQESAWVRTPQLLIFYFLYKSVCYKKLKFSVFCKIMYLLKLINFKIKYIFYLFYILIFEELSNLTKLLNFIKNRKNTKIA